MTQKMSQIVMAMESFIKFFYIMKKKKISLIDLRCSLDVKMLKNYDLWNQT